MTANAETSDSKQAKPAISVIIPAYNVAPFIRETIDSVLAQTFKDFETIVINDGSPDTAELESALDRYRDKITYVRQSNQGAGAARNAGLRLACGRYVAFLDGDDIWLPNYLEEQLSLIESDGGYDLVYADALNFGFGPTVGRTGMSSNPSSGKVSFEKLITADCNVITSAVLARREPIVRLGLFDESFRNSQDFDLWLRLAKEAKARITYHRQVLVRRRLYAGSLASDPTKSFQGEIAVLDKMSKRDDLTERERLLLNETIANRKATVETIRGKRSLLDGDFGSAAKSIALANSYSPRLKLRIVLFLLHTAPGLVSRVYRLHSASNEKH